MHSQRIFFPNSYYPLSQACMTADSSEEAWPKKDRAETALIKRAELQTALVVDDSQTERVHLGHILKDTGLEVLVAESGNQAKKLAELHEPDVIFLDIIMEDGDGYQTCRALRRNPATAMIPIIMVSSKSNPVDIKWAEKLGASGYIVKPFAADAIHTKLAELQRN